MLNTGIKQEAGQFFTPIPLTRFICKSIPIKEIIEDKNNKKDDNFLPYVIDYACGSGHFLTEIMDEIDTYVKDFKVEDIKGSRIAKENFESLRNNLKWSKEYVYGIEKDYRLVKTSKVSSFLNGDGEANVMAADGLAPFNDKKYKGILRTEELQKNNSKFDILVANPPYSISGFRTTLKDGKKCFDLYKRLTDNSSEIECLFVERAIQLLKEGGVAGIVLPVSILTNGGIYEKTRELILKNFDIVAIQKLGDNAFMATGTKTIILFMRRKSNLAYSNIEKLVDKFLTDFKDVAINGIEHAFSTYVNNIFEDISFEDYISILQDNPTENARKSEIFDEYKDYPIEKILEIEKEKLVYFIITYPQKIILSDSLEKDIEKEFYGYEFSNRKGHEGIHIYKDEDGVLHSKLYNPENLYDEEKTNYYILNNFKELNSEKTINEIKQSEDHPLKNHIDYINLSDLMSFDLKTFDKQINLNFKKKLKIDSKYPQVKLNEIAKLDWGNTSLTKEIYKNEGYKAFSASGQDGYVEKYEYDTEAIIVSAIGARCGKCFKADGKFTAIKNTLVITDFKNSLRNYIFEIINNENFWDKGGKGQPFIGVESARSKKLPLPPMNIQEEIVKEILALENLSKNNTDKVNILQNNIAKVLKTDAKEEKLNKYLLMPVKRGKSPKYSYKSDIQILKSGQIRGLKEFDFSKKYYADKSMTIDERLLQRGDLLINSTGVGTAGRVNLFNLNGKFFVDSHVAICRLNKELLLPLYALYQLYYFVGFKNIEKMATGQSGQIELAPDTIGNIKIPVPSIQEQKRIVTEIMPIEEEIEKLQKEIDEIPTKKQVILDKYLK